MKSKMTAAVLSLLLVLVVASTCFAVDPVGYIQTAEGTVTVTCEGGESKVGAYDLAIMPEDVITTGADSGAQIMFIDETVLALADNSKVAIHDVYTPVKGGMFDMNFLEGTARIITSKTLSGNPDRFKAMTPLGTIGIRGTEFGILADPDHEVVLLYEGGPAVYTDGQNVGLTGEQQDEVCKELGEALSDLDEAATAMRMGHDVMGKRKIKKQIANIRQYQQQYHCAP